MDLGAYQLRQVGAGRLGVLASAEEAESQSVSFFLTGGLVRLIELQSQPVSEQTSRPGYVCRQGRTQDEMLLRPGHGDVEQTAVLFLLTFLAALTAGLKRRVRRVLTSLRVDPLHSQATRGKIS